MLTKEQLDEVRWTPPRETHAEQSWDILMRLGEVIPDWDTDPRWGRYVSTFSWLVETYLIPEQEVPVDPPGNVSRFEKAVESLGRRLEKIGIEQEDRIFVLYGPSSVS